ncbi:MAG: dehydrogenase [Bacteroidales bacterium]|nr:dehydrogenase [Bacteroidales bacterium]
MVKSVAPLRIGLAGGGSDISPFCDIYGGAVVNVTINLYAHCKIWCTKDEIIFKSLDQNEESHHSMDTKIQSTGKLKLHKGVYNHIIRNYNENNPMSIGVETLSEAPIGSGIGSSSTLVVAMIKAYDELLGLELKPHEIASMAYKIERVELALLGGRQDQYSAVFGGFNFMEFKGNDSKITGIDVPDSMREQILASMFLYYTGKSRESSLIIDDQIRNSSQDAGDCIRGMHGMKKCACSMLEALKKNDFNGFIDSLVKGWEYKKMTSKHITNLEIEKLIKYIMDNGGLAVKISGAGGGGFLTVICKPQIKQQLMMELDSYGGKSFMPGFEYQGVKSWKTGVSQCV